MSAPILEEFGHLVESVRCSTGLTEAQARWLADCACTRVWWREGWPGAASLVDSWLRDAAHHDAPTFALRVHSIATGSGWVGDRLAVEAEFAIALTWRRSVPIHVQAVQGDPIGRLLRRRGASVLAGFVTAPDLAE